MNLDENIILALRYLNFCVYFFSLFVWCHGVRSYRSDDGDDGNDNATAVTCDFDRNAARIKMNEKPNDDDHSVSEIERKRQKWGTVS